jgi:transcriptional regulator with XRE-family HTH domain
MASRQRAVDRGNERGVDLIRKIGAEIRLARRGRGLSIASVARQVGVSATELGRIERADAIWVSVIVLARACAVVGLDLAARAYPGGSPIRDARHNRLLEKLHAVVHESLKWAIEVPLPGAGEQRAWDALIRGDGWRFGVECELNPMDGQALIRRLQMKIKDGMVDGLILLLPDTRQARAFRREFAQTLAEMFPIRGRVALDHLSNGTEPGGSAIVIL